MRVRSTRLDNDIAGGDSAIRIGTKVYTLPEFRGQLEARTGQTKRTDSIAAKADILLRYILLPHTRIPCMLYCVGWLDEGGGMVFEPENMV